jgi:3'-phosphoadenosine 5'-phosphosulfate sulfotransferase (PAPS reductase)/FAD synthetase
MSKIECVVPISGGKDSQACLVLALQHWRRDQILGLFCDTQFEHPWTYRHVNWMRRKYGVKIKRITAGSVLEKVRKYRRVPGGGARHCTEELKLVPAKKFYRALAEKQRHGFQVWLGMRQAESVDRAKRYATTVALEEYLPHEIMRKFPKYLAQAGVRFVLPIVDWSTEEVFRLLDGTENPLYRAEFDRVGCFPCLAAGDKHKAKAFAFDKVGKQHFIAVQQVSDEIGVSVWSSKAGQSGCLLCSI